MNTRTVILPVVLVVIFALTFQLVTAGRDVALNTSSDPASQIQNQQGTTEQNKAPIPLYRSRLEGCFDAPLREAASCQNVSQVPALSYRSRLDECFDVSLSELASCRKASLASAP